MTSMTIQNNKLFIDIFWYIKKYSHFLSVFHVPSKKSNSYKNDVLVMEGNKIYHNRKMDVAKWCDFYWEIFHRKLKNSNRTSSWNIDNDFYNFFYYFDRMNRHLFSIFYFLSNHHEIWNILLNHFSFFRPPKAMTFIQWLDTR